MHGSPFLLPGNQKEEARGQGSRLDGGQGWPLGEGGRDDDSHEGGEGGQGAFPLLLPHGQRGVLVLCDHKIIAGVLLILPNYLYQLSICVHSFKYTHSFFNLSQLKFL